MSDQDPLAGSAPSEQLPGIVARWEQDVADRRFATETGTSGGRTASVPLWEFEVIVAALPGLLARARDGERMAALDESLDDFHWRHVRPTGGGTETVAVLDWFFGDGDSSTTTSGATIREAVDAFLELMAADKPDDPAAAARSTGSVGNG